MLIITRDSPLENLANSYIEGAEKSITVSVK
jgi:hypothetical protein